MKNNFDEYSTKLTKNDVVEFIIKFNLDYEQSKSLFKIYKEKNCDLELKETLTSKVKECYKKYLITSLKNSIMPTKEDFIEYYNNTYKDDFRCFGYENFMPLTIRIFLVIINDKTICDELIGFESEFVGGAKSINSKGIKNAIFRENSHISFVIKSDKNQSKIFTYLLRKYEPLFKNIKNIPHQLKNYFVNQNIDKEDIRDFYKLLDLYMNLDKEIQEKFTGRDIENQTAELIKKDVINEVLANPSKFTDILKNYKKYFYYSKTMACVSNVLTFTELKREVQSVYIDKTSLSYLQYLASLYNKHNNMYEQVCTNKLYNKDFHNLYIESLLKKIPELEKECLLINERYKIHKCISLAKINEEEINVLATTFINSTYNNLKNFINSHKTKFPLFTKLEDEEIKLMIKSINLELYKQAINKETKCIDLIKLFLKSNYFSTKLFLEHYHKKIEDFEYALEFTKQFEPSLYYSAIAKLEEKTEQKYQLIIESTANIADKILNGIKNRDFNYLDYKLSTDLNLDEFLEIVKTELNLSKDELIQVYRFGNKYKEISYFKDEEIYNEEWRMGNRTVTQEEKEAAINFLNYYNLNKEIILYRQIIKAYFSRELDLTPFASIPDKKSKVLI